MIANESSFDDISADILSFSYSPKGSGMKTDDLQFGFKRKTGTSHAIYTLKSTVDYFVQNGSKVYVAFLDLTIVSSPVPFILV